MTTALKLTQKTIHTIAKATEMPPHAVAHIYEGYCSKDQTAYVVLNDICKHGDAQPPLAVEMHLFNTDFMFVTNESDTEFSEVIHI